jgi:diguanylate cyclase (GGDEF)-like protein
MRARYFYDDSGRPLRSVGVVIDVTARKQAEERLAHAALHDALTGLPNRTLLRERLAAATERAAGGESFAVLCLDLDRFKDVNDTLGHPFGDRLLIAVGERLSGELGAGDSLARLGGDEFAVLQAGLRSPEEAARLARRLVERIGEPFLIEGQRVVVGASIGIATAPRDGSHGDELLGAADLALYQAKSQKTRGWRFYEPVMNAQAQARRELERDLQHGLANEEFELFYQPALDVATLRVQAFEALIRWRRPQQGLLPSKSFIPLCEEMGLINQLGAWMLRRACKDAASWPAQIGVAVNVSAVQIGAGDFDAVVAAALAESGLAAERLELEITEGALRDNGEATLATLRRLKRLGVRIVMDDFGAGHFSLGCLQSFPFDKIKIDRAFAAEVDRSPQGAAIVKALLDLCAALGKATTIEGVETEAQFQALAGMGGQTVQGNLFSPPRPVSCAPSLLAQFGGVAALTQAAE